MQILIDVGDFEGYWWWQGERRRGSSHIDADIGAHEIGIAHYNAIRFLVTNKGGEVEVLFNNPCQAYVDEDSSELTIKFRTATVGVDPRKYQGNWSVVFVTDPDGSISRFGCGTVQLIPGMKYHFSVGYDGRFFIEIDNNGFLKDIVNKPWAYVDKNGLVLNNCKFYVSVDGYEGTWALPYVTKMGVRSGDHLPTTQPLPGQEKIFLVPGLRYSFSVGYHGRFYFDVDADGNFETDATDSVTVAATDEDKTVENRLVLRNVEISIEPGAYTGAWGLPYVYPIDWYSAPDSRRICVVPALDYEFSVGYDGRFQFYVDTDGSVFVDKHDSAYHDEDTLVLLTRTYKFKVIDGQVWLLPYVTRGTIEESYAEVTLVPDLAYTFRTGEGINYLFKTLPSGDIVSNHFQWAWPSGEGPDGPGSLVAADDENYRTRYGSERGVVP